jgi:S1-C subfamily serine protease
VDPSAEIIAEPAHPWVGRGALKLDYALSLWPVVVTARGVLDIGASTGGFTEVCLARGAAKVFAVDVGRGQLHPRLKADPRVVDLEATDARTLSKTVSNASGQLMTLALAENLHALMNSSEFRASATAPVVTSGQLAKPGALAPLKLASLAGNSTVADSVGSVVAVFAGGAMGSGFVVGDGYLITNHHVVGDATTVKVKWPDGLEFAGEVLRSDARRDVALIKTDTRGRPSLTVRTSPMQPGDTVFAIGTPLDPSLQNTVTRGVVSAMRTFEGFAYIQSDVSINHGNSGGPLLDEKARVVGLTVSGYEPNGAPAGLNFFIPIRDALDFLALSISGAG